MTPHQIELVAQAFYAAEYADEWGNAPEPVQKQFRDLASTAITLLNRQIDQCRSSPAQTNIPWPVRFEEAVQ